MSAQLRSIGSPLGAHLLVLALCACGNDDGNAPGGGGARMGGSAGSQPGGAGSGGSASAGGTAGASASGKAGANAGGGAGGSTSLAGSGGVSGTGTGGTGTGGAGDPTQALEQGNAFCEKIDAEDCQSLTTLEQCKAVLNRFVGKSQACLDATQTYWECALAAPDVCNVSAPCKDEGDASNELCF